MEWKNSDFLIKIIKEYNINGILGINPTSTFEILNIKCDNHISFNDSMCEEITNIFMFSQETAEEFRKDFESAVGSALSGFDIVGLLYLIRKYKLDNLIIDVDWYDGPLGYILAYNDIIYYFIMFDEFNFYFTPEKNVEDFRFFSGFKYQPRMYYGIIIDDRLSDEEIKNFSYKVINKYQDNKTIYFTL